MVAVMWIGSCDSSSHEKGGGQHIREPGVQGGWFALPDPALYAQYQARYQSSFNDNNQRTVTAGVDVGSTGLSPAAVLTGGTLVYFLVLLQHHMTSFMK